MIKKIVYILIPTCMTVSVAMAEPLSSPVLLSSDQMDQVTAGISAIAGAGAIASSPVLALTKAGTVTEVAGSQSTPGAGGAAAGGIALAGAAGQGSSTGTGVSAATSQSGPNTQSIQVGVNQSNQLNSISGGAIVSVNTIYNPL